MDQTQRLAALSERRSIRMDGPVWTGKEGAVAAPGTDASGRRIVIKIPRSSITTEAAALRAWDGCGAVRLLDIDLEHNALILERLGSALHAIREDESIDVVCRVARDLWIEPPSPHVFGTTTGMVDRWSRTLPGRRSELRTWCERFLLGTAERVLLELVDQPSRPLLLHGDLHRGNLLCTDGGGWRAIDPSPLVGDPAYDIAILMSDLLDSDVATPRAPTRLHHVLDVLSGLLPELEPKRILGWMLTHRLDLVHTRPNHDDPTWDLSFARLLARSIQTGDF